MGSYSIIVPNDNCDGLMKPDSYIQIAPFDIQPTLLMNRGTYI